MKQPKNRIDYAQYTIASSLNNLKQLQMLMILLITMSLKYVSLVECYVFSMGYLINYMKTGGNC